jgi:alcohol dehydrogenase
VLGIAKQAGAFREFFTLPERNLRRVPDLVPTEAAVFAEPLAAACEILDQARIPELDEIAVLGDGKLGLLIGQVLTVHGYEVHLFGKDPAKLRLAVKLGLMAEMAPRKLPRAAYNWVVEATGAPDGLRHALEMVRPRGTVILKSTLHRPVQFDSAFCVVHEITLLGSRCGRIEPALELLRTEKVDVLDMISDRFPLSRAPRAFERAAEKGILKVLLT